MFMVHFNVTRFLGRIVMRVKRSLHEIVFQGNDYKEFGLGCDASSLVKITDVS
jgi:hypothetical protein